MAIMTSDPLPIDGECLVEDQKLFPQVLILKLPTLPIPPAFIEPTKRIGSHSVDEVLRV